MKPDLTGSTSHLAAPGRIKGPPRARALPYSAPSAISQLQSYTGRPRGRVMITMVLLGDSSHRKMSLVLRLHSSRQYSKDASCEAFGRGGWLLPKFSRSQHIATVHGCPPRTLESVQVDYHLRYDQVPRGNPYLDADRSISRPNSSDDDSRALGTVWQPCKTRGSGYSSHGDFYALSSSLSFEAP